MGVKSKNYTTQITFPEFGPWPLNPQTVALYPGSKPDWAMKRWDKYDKLAEQFENVVVIGQKHDIESHGNPTWITRPWSWPSNVEFFTGTLAESAFLISHCKMFVGNDGGLAHVAAATGAPTFVLFGPSSPVKNKPYCENAHAIGINLECRPCQFQPGGKGKQIFDGGKGNCPRKMECMRKMSVDFVLKEIKKVVRNI
jgi:ADP-heptose:LPS heptosyltransferase